MTDNGSLSLFESAEHEQDTQFFKDRKFEDIVFSEVEWREREFYNCTFTGCSIMKARVLHCQFEKCSFVNCNIASVTVKHSAFHDVTFENSKVMGINWAQAAMPLSVDFNKCNINYSVFLGLNLTGIKICDCEARDVDFADANLTRASLTGTDLENARFLNTNLTKASFEKAVNYSVSPNHNLLRKTVFSMPEAVSLLADLDIVLK